MLTWLHLERAALSYALWFAYHATSAQAQIASWQGLRTGLIGNSIYAEGGLITNGTWDGERWRNTALMDSSRGALYRINLARPFDASNASQSLQPIIEDQDPDTPNYSYGAMYMGKDGFMLFGGMADKPAVDEGASSMTSVQLYPLSSSDDKMSNMVRNITIEPPVVPPVMDNPSLWHRCAGADASVPSEQLSFCVSGMRGENSSVLEFNSDDAAYNHPTVLINDMVTCNTTDLAKPACESFPLPSFVRPRAEAGLVWLPIDKQGMLVLIGGVEIPGDLYIVSPPKDTLDGPFMTQISLYSIATGSWYVQEVSSDEIPAQTAAFCTTLGIAHDYSSFNIYLYGGYDGTYMSDMPAVRDDVWVLSLPSFRWIRVYDAGPSAHGRQGHRCVSPYPNQMVTIGGTDKLGGSLHSPNFIDVFDMNDLSWAGVYDPLNWSEYKVPKKISNVIGGNENGGSIAIADLNNAELADLFKTRYKGHIPKYYPYATNSLRDHIKGVPQYIRLIVGVLSYLTLCSFAFVAVIVLRRRLQFRNHGIKAADLQSEKWLVAWMHNADGKEQKTALPAKDDKKVEVLRIPYLDDEDDLAGESSSQGKSTGTSIRSNQPLFSDDIELRTLTTSP